MSIDPDRLNRDEILEKLTELNREQARLSQELARKIRQLETAREQIKVLEGKIPICMHCKSIRDEKNKWHNLETYMSEHTSVWFTHTICPECMGSLYGFMNPG